MKGIYVATVTPFDREGHLDAKGAEALYEKLIGQGADGFFVGGSSGECFLMTPQERVAAFETAFAYHDQVELYAHVGALGTEEAIYYAKCAKEIGYDKIAAVPPFYFGLSSKDIAQYFYDISKAVELPVLYYNIPGNTHRVLDLNDPVLEELVCSGALAGVKHTNLDIYEMERIRHKNRELLCFGGFEQNMVAFLAMGCDGFIGSTFNFMLPHYRKVYQLFLDGKIEEARELQVKANNIMEVICKVGLFPAIKYILDCQGLCVGQTRRPFLPLEEGQKNQVDQVLKENLYQVSTDGKR
ncbi:MAG: dihydrodipicolinate synthase family protein [Blautia sp.]|jgi:N-acetylneuraminate lyase